MYKRREYILHNIKWFQKLNPKMFHDKIRFNLFKYYGPIVNNIQKGGYKNKNKDKEIEFLQTYKGFYFKINIRKTEQEFLINMLTHIKKNKEPLDCANIVIDKKSKTANITNISFYPECFLDENFSVPTKDKKVSGTVLLKFIIGFLKKNKNSFGITKIQLSDNSLKPCNNCPHNIRLTIMHTLLYGDTWYGQYGFRPCDPDTKKIDKKKNKLYEKNKKIVENAKVKDVDIIRYLNGAINKYKLKNYDKTKIVNQIKLLQNEKLSDFLLMFLKNYDKNCCLFHFIGNKIFDKLKLYDFYFHPFCLIF